jgi:hypothetical protein
MPLSRIKADVAHALVRMEHQPMNELFSVYKAKNLCLVGLSLLLLLPVKKEKSLDFPSILIISATLKGRLEKVRLESQRAKNTDSRLWYSLNCSLWNVSLSYQSLPFSI